MNRTLPTVSAGLTNASARHVSHAFGYRYGLAVTVSEARPEDRSSAPLQQLLLRWSETGLRDLPWRRTRDPWAVLLSEVMLQQTQTSRVEPKWHLFLDRYPNPHRLRDSPMPEVLELWQGLGYPRRAQALRRLVGEVADRFDGEVPGSLDDLLSLPGLGPYTARAVMVFAFERDGLGVLDTNTARVIARAVAGRALQRREAQAIADRLSPTGHAWRWNQAMLDVGARHCAKRSPRCDGCPLAAECVWLRNGGADPAIGSAGVSTKQSRFEGSDRQARGAILRILGRGPCREVELLAAPTAVADIDRYRRALRSLLADELVMRADDGSIAIAP
jgi:A/G-specific adenine glycosylase